MKPPICKLCGKAHWTYEEHAGSETEVPGYVKEMAAGAMGRTDIPEKRTEKTISVQAEAPLNVRKRGRPKKWESEAERLRAYRERSK